MLQEEPPAESGLLTDLLQVAAAHPIATIVGFIGLLGSIASIISIAQSRRKKQIQDYLFKVAERNLEKDLTDADIERKKQEATELAGKVLDLQLQIERDIPIEAKRAVLRDRLDSHAASLAHTYKELMATQTTLNQLGEERELPKEVLRAVEEQIQPKYLRRERVSNAKTFLAVTSAAAAASSTLAPPPFGRLLGTAFLLATVPIIVALLRLTISRDALTRRVPYSKRTLTATALTLASAAIALLALLQSRLGTREDLLALSALSAFFLALPAWVYALIGYRKLKRSSASSGTRSAPNPSAAPDS